MSISTVQGPAVAADDPPLPASGAVQQSSSLSLLLQIGRSERLLLLVALLGLLAASAASLTYPRYIRVIVDGSVQAISSAELTRLCLQMLALSAVLGVAVAVRQVAFGLAGERIVKRLREQLYASLLRQDITFFDAHHTSVLTSRLTVDVGLIRAALTMQGGILVRSVLQIGGGLALLLYTSVLLGSVTICTLIVLVVLIALVTRRSRRIVRQANRVFDRAAVLAQESVDGIRTVRACAAREFELERYRTTLGDAQRVARSGMLLGEGLRGLVSFSAYATSVIMFWLGGHLMARGELTIGDLTAFFAYSVMIASAFSSVGDAASSIMQATVATERLLEMLGEPRTQHGSLSPREARGALQLRAVRFAYPGQPEVLTLDQVDIPAGQSVALVGPSGSGKSTLAALITHLYDPVAGQIMLDGHDIRTLDDGWFRDQVAVVPQEPLLFSGTIAENIRYGRAATQAEVEAVARAAAAHDFIQARAKGYETHVSKSLLSGGERQRIAIARALLRGPKVLVLDEATGALDGENEYIVRSVLEKMAGRVTLLIVSHRLAAIASVDRILVMEAGRITHDGSHRELMQSCSVYRRLVELGSVVGQTS